MSHNRAILLGNVGKDPDIRATNSGDRVATFRMATSETWKDKATGEKKESTEWHSVVVFNQALVGVIESWVKKGSRVLVEGQIKTREYTGTDGVKRWVTEIVIGRFDGRLSLEGQPQGRATPDERGYGTTSTRTASASAASTPADIGDDIPF